MPRTQSFNAATTKHDGLIHQQNVQQRNGKSRVCDTRKTLLQASTKYRSIPKYVQNDNCTFIYSVNSSHLKIILFKDILENEKSLHFQIKVSNK